MKKKVVILVSVLALLEAQLLICEEQRSSWYNRNCYKWGEDGECDMAKSFMQDRLPDCHPIQKAIDRVGGSDG